MMNAVALVGWGLALVAVVAGYAGYGWRGVLLALTVIVFWLVLQFSRSLRVLREAAARPVGSVANAVMLHSRLHAGMRLPQILRLTRSLGRGEGAGAEAGSERFSWTDAGGDAVHLELQGGRLVRWDLQRAAGDAAPDAPSTARPGT